MAFSDDELEKIEVVYEDLAYLRDVAGPECDDHQLRRISVQMRHLINDDRLIQAWKLLAMEPKQPVIVAPRLRHKDLDANAIAVAGGGQVGGVNIGIAKIMPGRAMTEKELKELHEKERGDIEFPWSLSDYKQSCGIFIQGKAIQRRQVVAFVANKKGGAHLDTSRKKDEEAYRCLDEAIKSGLLFGGRAASGQYPVKGKDPVYLELLSIAQQVTASTDIGRLMDACKAVLKPKRY